jgi:hypothetical protein
MRARWGEKECWATWEGDGSRGRRDRRCGGPPGSGGKTVCAPALAAVAAKPYEGELGRVKCSWVARRSGPR